MLDLKSIDLDDLAQALDDHSYEHSWWLDPRTGEVVLWSEYFEEQGELDPETRGLRAIDPIPSHEGYADMEDFIERVRNPQARDLLERAIAGRGAFRRFKDTLLDFPELREAWFRFHDARVERRAIWWLVDEGLVDQAEAERAIAERPDAELPELSGPFGATDAVDSTVENVEVVERFLAAFERRWPAEDELAELVAPDVRFVERPNLINPAGSDRDAAGMSAGLERGRQLLAWQSYEVRDHVAVADTVVTRMRWRGELAVDAGPWPAGTQMTAWCVAHYRLAAGRIIHIEQHDCYEQPATPRPGLP